MRFSNIDCDRFVSELNNVDLEAEINDDVNITALNITEYMYVCASKSRLRGELVVTDDSRWERIPEDNDQDKLWKAINWRGEMTENPSKPECKPSDETFKTHFESVFNPPNTVYPDVNELVSHITNPVLDEPISSDDVVTQIETKS